MRFRIIADCCDEYPVRVLCDALGVSPSGYYAWRTRPESPRKAANRQLLGDIRRLHDTHRLRYGVPRIHAALRANGHTASRGRLERLMRRHGLQAQRAKTYRVCTTDSRHGFRRRPEPDWGLLACELKRPGVTLLLLWEEYRAQQPEGYGYSRFCELFRAFEMRLSPVMRQDQQYTFDHVKAQRKAESGNPGIPRS